MIPSLSSLSSCEGVVGVYGGLFNVEGVGLGVFRLLTGC